MHGGLKEAIAAEPRWAPASLSKCAQALHLLGDDPVANLVRQAFYNDDRWFAAAAECCAALNEGAERYEKKCKRAVTWLRLALRADAEHARPLPNLGQLQQAIYQLHSDVPAALDADCQELRRELLEGCTRLGVMLDELRRGGQPGRDAAAEAPAWTRQPLVPQPAELDVPPEPSPNRTEGAYDSVSAYLQTHFDLLRADFLRPLCEALGAVRAGQEAPLEVRVLWRVRLGGTVVGEPGGVLHTLHLSEDQFASLGGEGTKGMINGALLLLSPDGFRTVRCRSRMLPHAPACSRLLVHARACSRMLAHARAYSGALRDRRAARSVA